MGAGGQEDRRRLWGEKGSLGGCLLHLLVCVCVCARAPRACQWMRARERVCLDAANLLVCVCVVSVSACVFVYIYMHIYIYAYDCVCVAVCVGVFSV